MKVPIVQIQFTKHAQEKFQILQRHGINISPESVEKTVCHPTLVDYSRKPLLIAQGPLDKRLVLRVVYSQEARTIRIITFYPGRKEQYEKKR